MAAMKRVKLLVRYGNYAGELSPKDERSSSWAGYLWALLVAAAAVALWLRAR